MGAKETLLVTLVVGLRFLVPLLIPRYPLPAVVASLVLDAADQSIFHAFGYDPPHYQSYDKAMDVYYLAIAYVATLRNWTSPSAYRVARSMAAPMLPLPTPRSCRSVPMTSLPRLSTRRI